MFRTEIPIEIQDIVDDVVRDQLKRHPDVVTDGDKIFNIYGILGLGSNLLAKVLGIEEERLAEVIKEGIDENLKSRLDKSFAYASILEHEVHEPYKISGIIRTKTEALKKAPYSRYSPLRSPLECMMQGDIDLVLFETQMRFQQLNEQR